MIIKAIYFDAVGTLIHPQQPVFQVYWEAGQRGGSQRSPEEIESRFRDAFKKQETKDRDYWGWQTSEAREKKRWQDIVLEVLEDAADPEACFLELYDHFGLSKAWTFDPQGLETLQVLERWGYQVGIASNYDHRLRSVLAGHPQMKGIERVIISSEVGWRKPSSAFFGALHRQAGLLPQEVLFVGDDLQNDFQGAIEANLQSLLFDPQKKHPELGNQTIQSLGEVEAWILMQGNKKK